MSSTVFRSGIGRLRFERGPDELRVWSVEQVPESALYGGLVEVNLLLEGTDDIDAVDLVLVGEVLGRLDHYLETGLRFVREALEAEPEFFGLTEAESESYRSVPDADFPLDAPQLNFYADEWHLRFAEGRLPVCEPFGLVIAFSGQRPLRVEDVSDAAAVDTDGSGRHAS